MEKPIYMPFKTYLKEVFFDSPRAPLVFINDNNNTKVEITFLREHKVLEESSIYEVELHADIVAKTCNGVAYNMDVVYGTIVEIFEENISDEELRNILNVEIPQFMYNPLKAFVWNFTKESGFPPLMLNEYDFKTVESDSVDEIEDNDIEDNEEDNDDDSELYSEQESSELSPSDNVYPLGYDWIIESMRLDESGAKFLETLRQKEQSNLANYEDSSLYKYFLRFIIPIDYAHPTFSEDECEESFWGIFFQFIFAECDDVQIIDNGTELPELEFTYQGTRRTVSSMSLGDLKEVLEYLVVDIYTKKAATLCCYEINKLYYSSEEFSMNILDTQFEDIFNYDDMLTHDEVKTSVKEMYKRIKECQLQTFAYRI